MRKIFRALLFCRCVAVKLEDRDSFRKRSMAIEDLHEPKSSGWVRTPFTKNGAEKKQCFQTFAWNVCTFGRTRTTTTTLYYCWWFVRNPANSPVEFGSLNPIIHRVSYKIQKVVGLGNGDFWTTNQQLPTKVLNQTKSQPTWGWDDLKPLPRAHVGKNSSRCPIRPCWCSYNFIYID